MPGQLVTPQDVVVSGAELGPLERGRSARCWVFLFPFAGLFLPARFGFPAASPAVGAQGLANPASSCPGSAAAVRRPAELLPFSQITLFSASFPPRAAVSRFPAYPNTPKTPPRRFSRGSASRRRPERPLQSRFSMPGIPQHPEFPALQTEPCPVRDIYQVDPDPFCSRHRPFPVSSNPDQVLRLIRTDRHAAKLRRGRSAGAPGPRGP